MDVDVPEVPEVIRPDDTVIAPPQVDKPANVSPELLETIKSRVLSNLTGRNLPKPLFLDSELSRVYSLLENAIRFGEGNSCIIVGPRGTGKSLIVESALSELTDKYGSNFITIRLSGFAQSDDKMAVREIARQLDSVLPETIESKSMSETLSQLLSLFEKADEDQTEKETVSLVFILDEFDRFCATTKQTLLYNLFDVAQSSRAPIAVVGLTSRINARELLEKRVRSRFSQRVIQVKRQQNMVDFWAVLRNAVCVPLDITSPDSIKSEDSIKVEEGEEGSRDSSASSATPPSEEDVQTIQYWNYHWEEMFQAGPLRDHVERIYHTTKSCREFFTSALLAVARADPWVDAADFALHSYERGIADTESFVDGLSDLELCMVICAAKVEVMFDVDQLNFNLAYEEYHKTAREQREAMRAVDLAGMATGTVAGFRIWSRDVARAAWEKLESLNLLTSIEKSAKRIAKNASEASLDDEIRMVKVDVGLQELTNMMGNTHHLIQWTRVRR